MANDLKNGSFIADIQEMMRDTGFGLKQLPAHLEVVLSQGMWKHRIIQQTGEVAEFERFKDFVEAPLVAGLESDIEQIKRLCSNNDAITDLIDQAIQNPNGGDRKSPEARIRNDNGNSDIPSGNEQAYALRRLRKSRPDLHSKVLKGELSSNSAMIEAGFRRKTLNVPLDPEKLAQTIKRHFNEEQIAKLIALLLGAN